MTFRELMAQQDKGNYPFIAAWSAIGLLLGIVLGGLQLPFWPVIVWMVLGWALCVVRTMRKVQRGELLPWFTGFDDANQP